MNREDPVEIGRAIAKLGLWRKASGCNWAVRPLESAVPWFARVPVPQPKPVKARLMLFPGWKPFHNFMMCSRDPDFGTAMSPVDIEHLELMELESGETRLLDCSPGYAPADPAPERRTLMAKLLWQCWGYLMRLEEDETLPMKFAGEKAMFSRRENAKDVWEDSPVRLDGAPPAFVERVALEKALVAKASDLPFDASLRLELDLFMLPGLRAGGARARNVYLFAAVDAATGARCIWTPLVVDGSPDGLLNIWQGLAQRLLSYIASSPSVPGEIKVRSMRMVRFLRPLGMELPFKLSVNSKLPALDSEVRRAIEGNGI